MRLSETIDNINSALNYPALTYIDIKLFFDTAISELNTTLHTSIPLVSEMVEEFRQKMSKEENNKVIITSNPASSDYAIVTDPENPTGESVPYYFSTVTNSFFIYNKYKGVYEEYPSIKGIWTTSEGLHLFQSVVYASGNAVWAEMPIDPQFEAELSDYLPNDWVLLWLIPYVCYEYTVRDGGTAQTFAEKLSQGFQQLQETYNVPDKILLATYADKPAYTKLVEENLPNLNIWVPTRAIYEKMKHARTLNAVYGSFYDRGGF